MVPSKLPDILWEQIASFLEERLRPDEFILAPNEFLWRLRGTIALHVRKRMLEDTTIAHFVLHKGMLDRVDPLFLREAMELCPVFANEVFVVFSRHGERLPDAQSVHLGVVTDYVASLPSPKQTSETIGLVVTTYNRSWALARTLASLRRHGKPLLVVDDGSDISQRDQNEALCRSAGASYVCYPENLGLANALNVGIGHWLAHPAIEWISVFNDDIELATDSLAKFDAVIRNMPQAHRNIYTGYTDRHHPAFEEEIIAKQRVLFARSSSGVHLHAHRSYWQRILPIPTAYLGAPKKAGGSFEGQGCDTDWWIASWSPQSAPKRGGRVVVLPGLVTTFATDATSSTWGNASQ